MLLIGWKLASNSYFKLVNYLGFLDKRRKILLLGFFNVEEKSTTWCVEGKFVMCYKNN
jgi:hypothetical protein